MICKYCSIDIRIQQNAFEFSNVMDKNAFENQFCIVAASINKCTNLALAQGSQPGLNIC